MDRKRFIKHATIGTLAMGSLGTLAKAMDWLKDDGMTMPALFVGHGSPTNSVEDNEFTKAWKQVANQLPVPKAILCVSAHWLTRGTYVTAMAQPPTIHDHGPFGGLTDTLLYPAPGAPEFAGLTKEVVTKTQVMDDHQWGLDHGTWSVLAQMYPKADIPVYQLSLDYSRSPQFHYELAQELASLRKKGVLIIGSGNIVHNLRMIDWRNPDSGFDWAIEFDDRVRQLIDSRSHGQLANYNQISSAAKFAIPTNEHYLPMLYALAVQGKDEELRYFNDKCMMGSLSMRSFVIG